MLKYGERIDFECKRAESKLPNSVWETYSSFANTDGGIILFGVEENQKECDFEQRFSFVSIHHPEQRLKDFWNTLNSEKVSSNILIDADVGLCEIQGATIMWIHVPQASYRQRPVYINGNPLKGSFKRNYEGDYHCTEEEVKAMLRDANDSGNDGGLLNGYTMDDIDANSLRSYRIEFEHRNPEHIWNGETDKTFLKNLGGYALDRTTGKEWLTAAGLLMFGKGIAIRDRFTDSNLNHTGIYLYSKGKIMIHLTFDYKTDEKCTTPGQYLKYHRTFQGLSTRELAEKVGIVPATLVLYENDRHPIKHSTAVALANALGIDRNRLLDKYTAFVDYPYSSLLKKVRQDLSLTQIQMAELIGIGQTSYSGWEREIRVPRRKEYDKILAALEKLRVNVDTYLCQSASI